VRPRSGKEHANKCRRRLPFSACLRRTRARACEYAAAQIGNQGLPLRDGSNPFMRARVLIHQQQPPPRYGAGDVVTIIVTAII